TGEGRLQARANLPGSANPLAIEVHRPSGLDTEALAEWTQLLAGNATFGLKQVRALLERQAQRRASHADQSEGATAPMVTAPIATAPPVASAVIAQPVYTGGEEEEHYPADATSAEGGIGSEHADFQLPEGGESGVRVAKKGRLTPRKIAIMLT